MRMYPVSRSVLIALFGLMSLAACTGPERSDPDQQHASGAAIDENAQVMTWFDARFAEELSFSPLRKTMRCSTISCSKPVRSILGTIRKTNILPADRA